MNTPSNTAAAQQLSESLMKKYTDLIYDVTGIRIPQQKRTLMSNRIRRRLRAIDCEGYEQYFQKIKSLSRTDREWDAFLQEVTTHETYLFRDEVQWQWFRESFLPDLVAQARKNERPRRLRIWSAACSTGDEPHTIATCVAGCLPNHSQWDIKILGTDIGIGALEEARMGVFGERAMRLVPKSFVSRFFTNNGEEWTAKPIIKDMLEFRQHNLLDSLREQPFDLVFVKNVLIYFDRESKRPVMDSVKKLIVPGGYLVSGPAEGISDYVQDLKRIEPWLFHVTDNK